MKVRTLKDLETADIDRWPNGIIPKGKILNNASSHLLIDLGVAEPAGALAELYVKKREAATKEQATRQRLEVERRTTRLRERLEREADSARLAEQEFTDQLTREAEEFAGKGEIVLADEVEPPIPEAFG